jgi:hypothetical protein
VHVERGTASHPSAAHGGHRRATARRVVVRLSVNDTSKPRCCRSRPVACVYSAYFWSACSASPVRTLMRSKLARLHRRLQPAT